MVSRWSAGGSCAVRTTVPAEIRCCSTRWPQFNRPPDPLYIFGAGESSTLREVRRSLVDTWDINRKYTNLAGYWKRPDDEDDWFYPRIEETG